MIREGEWGYCYTRFNRKGTLFSTIYGEVTVWRKAPIEIKPVYHYLPGSHAFSVGSVGCNFLCPGCQNWDISFARLEGIEIQTDYISPKELIHLARKYGCEGVSWTYNEPTLWLEYTLDGAKLAKATGLYTNYVTNGFLTVDALDLIGPYLDVFRVDIKAFNRDAYRRIAHIGGWKRILEITERAKHHWNMHVEVVTNLVPGVNDDLAQLRGLARWIRDHLGAETPWHLTRFYPHWRWKDYPVTPLERMEVLRDMALAEGLKFVYLGNVPGHPANHTYCPRCGRLVIERREWERVKVDLQNGRCPDCGEEIYGVFQRERKPDESV